MSTNRMRDIETLLVKYHADLYKYACWLIGDTSIAQDVLQEAFYGHGNRLIHCKTISLPRHGLSPLFVEKMHVVLSGSNLIW